MKKKLKDVSADKLLLEKQSDEEMTVNTSVEPDVEGQNLLTPLTNDIDKITKEEKSELELPIITETTALPVVQESGAKPKSSKPSKTEPKKIIEKTKIKKGQVENYSKNESNNETVAPTKGKGKSKGKEKIKEKTGGKGKQSPKKDEEVVESTDNNSEKKIRSFKVKLPNKEEFEGRFTGLTPYQAANKALSKYFRETAEPQTEITFSICESTRKSKKTIYTYIGKRQKLEIPVTYKIQDGREIVKNFKNSLKKIKKADI